ncbi:MAG: riboflavin biosynthesis protein RibD, partial [Tannerella sp.]|nr:riboflavin biosynthesis protein RibD [Tannerella sp.]
MQEEEKYMMRCLTLARAGASSVAPNPMVGAVVVRGGRIIGEGYHRQFGEP